MALNPYNLEPGKEQYDYFNTAYGRNRVKRCQYDYRATNGELFSCVGKTLDDCKAKRDAWLESKGWEA